MKKVVRKTEVKEETQEILKLKKLSRIPTDELQTAEAIKLKPVIKPEVHEEERVYAKAVTEVSVKESYEAEISIETYETARRAERTPLERNKRTPDEPDQFKKPKEVPVKDTTEDRSVPLKTKPKDEKGKVDEPGLKKTAKAPKEGSPKEPSLALKKVSKLPSDTKEPETVKLKPFEKTGKPEPEPEKPKKDEKDRKPEPFQKGERPQKDQLSKEPVAPKKKEEPSIPDQKEKDTILKKPVEKVPTDEAAQLRLGKAKRIPSEEQEVEKVQLKPFAKPTKTDSPVDKKVPESKETKSTEIKKPTRTPREEISKEPEAQLKKIDRRETPEKELEKVKKAELPSEVEKKPSPRITPLKKKEPTPKEEEKPVQLKKVEQRPKEVEPKEKEVPLKPVALLKSVELKKTPSPMVEKPKPKAVDAVPVEKRPSADIAKKIPKKISPKEFTEAVTLKKVPQKISPKEEKTEPSKAGKGTIPVMKELSPGAVRLRKISTQQEEEVDELEHDPEEEDDEEEWGWELAPRESYGSEDSEEQYLEEGALETPGMVGGRRGERGWL